MRGFTDSKVYNVFFLLQIYEYILCTVYVFKIASLKMFTLCIICVGWYKNWRDTIILHVQFEVKKLGWGARASRNLVTLYSNQNQRNFNWLGQSPDANYTPSLKVVHTFTRSPHEKYYRLSEILLFVKLSTQSAPSRTYFNFFCISTNGAMNFLGKSFACCVEI